MSESYSPAPGTTPIAPYTTVFLSQRDLGLQVPINFVTTPGVSFTAACFPHMRYEDDNSGDCLSNLLGVGFRRFEIDLYWDQDRQVWSFCPVILPTTVQNVAPSSVATLNSTSGLLVAATLGSDATPSSLEIKARETAAAVLTTSGLETSGASTLGTTLPTVTPLPDSPNTPAVSIGPYVCSTTINLSTFTSQLLDYIRTTENTIDANLIYVILNIHAAASDTSPLAPAPSPSVLPDSSNQLGSLISGNLSSYIYTPVNLRSDRGNLNNSWYSVPGRYGPVEDYYSTTTSGSDIVSTSDGWPSTSYIQFFKSKRLLIGFGSVDPQLAGYDFAGDEGFIFPSGYIQDDRDDVIAISSGQLTSGCFFMNGTVDLSKQNSSWAVDTLSGLNYTSTQSSDLTPLLNLTSETTKCGISPTLNVTLLNSTARENYIPYQNYSYSTIWSWAPGEPKAYTPGSAVSSSLFRCATSNIDLVGRWAVSDCSQKYYAACRYPGQPYNWTVTTYSISYSYAADACPHPYEFAAPRTALENRYLSQAIQNSHRDFDGHGALVDFNSLSVEGCWTTGGPNATCPYGDNGEAETDLKRKTVLVPVFGALIVLVVAALTIFVKVAGNRQVRKRTRKRDDFVYEGVPS